MPNSIIKEARMKQWVHLVVALFVLTAVLVAAVFALNLISFSKMCGLLKRRLVYISAKLHLVMWWKLLWNARRKRRDSETSEDDIEMEEGEGSRETAPVGEV
jgi:hypothetical protein